jgi:hypothetical protein
MLRFLINLTMTAMCTYLATVAAQEREYGLLLLPTAALAVQALVNYLIMRKDSRAVRAILRLLYERGCFAAEDNVRVTLLKPDGLRRSFRQIARYSPAEPGLTNHKFHIDKGVAGLARRTRSPQHFVVIAAFHNEIIRELGFSEKEARAFIQKAAYFCVPVFDKKKEVSYIVSIDSDQKNTFTDAVRLRIMSEMTFAAVVLTRAYEDEDAAIVAGFYG